MAENGLARIETSELPLLSAAQVGCRMRAIQDLMREQMESGLDYGTIPGTGGKPTLLQPGAQKLLVMFQLDPQFATVKHFQGEHLTVETYCTVYHAPSGVRLGGASAMCSTREAKYRWRGGSRLCPECGKPAIKRSKFPPRNAPDEPPGFYCFAKVGGCGANFGHDDERVTSQSEERQENPDLADAFNTVVRMSEKRALVAAVRLVTGASAIFDDDAATVQEGQPEVARPVAAPKPEPKPEQPAPQPRAKVAEALCKSLIGCDDEEGVDVIIKGRPKGFLKIQDEHSRAVEDTTRHQRLIIRQARIEQLREQLGFDDVRMSLAAQQVGLADMERQTPDGAAKLIAALEAEAGRTEAAQEQEA